MDLSKHHVKDKKTSLAELLFIGLIASLPFFSLRIGLLGVNLPLIFLAAIMVIVCLDVFIHSKIKVGFSHFDQLIVAYLFLALFSFIHTDENLHANFAFTKSILYFSSFLAVKALLATVSREKIERALLSGVILGTSLFVILAIYVLVKKNLLSNLDFSYYGLTYKVFSGFYSLFGSNDAIKSADIMRNAIGEVFAFYFIVIFVANIQSRWTKILYVLSNFILVISMFSRRAFLAIMATISIGFFRSQNRIVLLGFIMVVGLGILIFLSTEGTLKGGRLTDFSDASRVSQYASAMDLLNQKPLFGHGFGFKLDGKKYIHNFILSSSVMMGVAGLVFSLAIYFFAVWRYVEGLLNKSNTPYSFLLIVPIFGMTIGSTVEGIFTPISWIIFATYEAHRRKVRASRPFVQKKQKRLIDEV